MAVKVRERPTGSGKWWIYTDFRGKRTARYIPQGKRVAEKVASQIAAKLDLIKQTERHGLTVSPREVITGRKDLSPVKATPAVIGPLFSEYAAQWLNACEARGLKASTYRSYKTILNNHLLPAFGPLHLSEVDRRAVKLFVQTKLSEELPTNRKNASKKKIRATRTVLHFLRALSALFNAAIEDHYPVVNPALNPGKLLRTKRTSEDINPFDRDEEATFLQAVLDRAPRYYPFFLTLLRTGCRLGEAIALQPGDLDFRGKFIEIRRNFTNGKLTTPKSNKPRRVDMSDRLIQVLKDHLVSQELEAMHRNRSKPEWLFTNDVGQRLDPDNVRNRVFYRLLEKAQIRRIRIHDLRHTYATRLVSNNESLAYVRDQMGHSSIQVTVDLYSHYVPGSNRQAVNRLDDLVDLGETEVKSATSRNQDSAGALEYSKSLINGAGEWNRTTDLRFTKQARTIFEKLGVSNGFPVLTAKTGTCLHSIDSMDSRCIGGF